MHHALLQQVVLLQLATQALNACAQAEISSASSVCNLGAGSHQSQRSAFQQILCRVRGQTFNIWGRHVTGSCSTLSCQGMDCTGSQRCRLLLLLLLSIACSDLQCTQAVLADKPVPEASASLWRGLRPCCAWNWSIQGASWAFTALYWLSTYL